MEGVLEGQPESDGVFDGNVITNSYSSEDLNPLEPPPSLMISLSMLMVYPESSLTLSPHESKILNLYDPSFKKYSNAQFENFLECVPPRKTTQSLMSTVIHEVSEGQLLVLTSICN